MRFRYIYLGGKYVRFMNGVALDIGHALIKIASLHGQRVTGYATVPMGEGMGFESEESAKALGTHIKSVMKDRGIPAGDCALALSGSDVIIRLVTLPLMPSDELMENVRYEIGSYLPVDLNMYHIDCRALELGRQDGGAVVTLMVVAVQKDLLALIELALGEAGLNPARLDAADNAREKLLLYALGERQILPNACFIDIGAHRIKIAIYDEGRFFINKVMEGGSHAITEALAARFGLSVEEAERRKRNDNLLFGNAPDMVRETLTSILDDWVGEAGRVSEFYSRRAGRPRVSCVYLLGGGSAMPGCERYFTEKLGLPVLQASSLLERLKGIDESDKHLYFDALGAALLR